MSLRAEQQAHQPEKMSPTNNTNGSEEMQQEASDHTAAYILYGFLSFFTLIANSMVLLLIWRNRNLRSTSNLILTSLATSDLLTGFIAVPMVIACSETLRPEVCITMDIANRFLAFSSVGHLILLSVDRYLRIKRPLQYPSMVTEERVYSAIAVAWVFALLASLVQLTWILTVMDEYALIRIELAYDVFCMAVLVVMPLIIMVFIYTKIFMHLRWQSNQIHSEISTQAAEQINTGRRKVNEKRVALVLITMAAVFILGLFLYFFWAIMDDLGELGLHFFPEATDIIVTCVIFFRFFTALCNPLLYTFNKQDFFDALKSFLRELCLQTG